MGLAIINALIKLSVAAFRDKDSDNITVDLLTVTYDE